MNEGEEGVVRVHKRKVECTYVRTYIRGGQYADMCVAVSRYCVDTVPVYICMLVIAETRYGLHRENVLYERCRLSLE